MRGIVAGRGSFSGFPIATFSLLFPNFKRLCSTILITTLTPLYQTISLMSSLNLNISVKILSPLSVTMRAGAHDFIYLVHNIYTVDPAR